MLLKVFCLLIGLVIPVHGYFDPCNSDTSHSTRSPEASKQRIRRAATSQTELLWKDGIVPYKISDRFLGKEKLVIHKAFHHWEERTCLSFVERTTETEYVIFQRNPKCGCVSYVGRMGENQAQGVNLSDKCVIFGSVLHEIGHLIGFWHEFTRPDRDQHLTVIARNIQTEKLVNFVKKATKEVNSFGVKYDFGSIMHYSQNAFSKNPSFADTIIPKTHVNIVPVAQRKKISNLDVVQTNLLYKCPSCMKTYTKSNGIINYKVLNVHNTSHACQWRIFAPAGQLIKLNFVQINFMLPCESSYLVIRNGKHSSSPLLEKFCKDKKPPKSMTLLSQSLFIQYYMDRADDSEENQGVGMKLSYRVLGGGQLTSASGVINSPNYPNTYDSNQFCEWNITVAENSTIAFDFKLLRVMKSKNCMKDYIEIIDGALGKSLGRFCKFRQVKLFTTSSNKATVRFHSNGNKVKDGFSLSYFTETNECATNNGNCLHECINLIGGYKCACAAGYQWNHKRQRCEPTCIQTYNMKPNDVKVFTSPNYPSYYPNNKSCKWRFIGLPGYKIYLNVKVFKLAHAQSCDNASDRVDILEKGRNIMSLCGDLVTPIKLTSVKQEMTVKFTSNDENNSQGFYAEVQLDKNECEINNGGCQHICKNILKSFECECRPGYELSKDKRTCKPGNCTFASTKNRGIISSPDYPDIYPGDNTCSWVLKTTPGHKYIIDVLTPRKDWNVYRICPVSLQHLHEDNWIADRNICLLLSKNKPIESTHHVTRLKFQSKPNTHGFKFRLSYRTTCGGQLKATKHSQNIFSHVGYTDRLKYPANQNCSWVITTGKRRQVRIRFKKFNMEHEPCVFDYVSIYDGAFSYSPLIARLCGSKLSQKVYTSTNNALRINFVTDANFHRYGFALEYSKVHSDVNTKKKQQKKNAIVAPVRRTRDFFLFEVDSK